MRVLFRATSFNNIPIVVSTGEPSIPNWCDSVTGVDSIAVTTTAAIAPLSTSLGNTSASAQAEIAKLDTDIANVAAARATYGAVQSRF